MDEKDPSITTVAATTTTTTSNTTTTTTINKYNNSNNNVIKHVNRDDSCLPETPRRRFHRGTYLATPTLPTTEEMTSSPSLPPTTQPVTQTLLVPPASSFRRERRGSTSSLDSTMSHHSHSGRGKRHKRSSARLSELEHERHDVTLMTFATKTSDVFHAGYSIAQRILSKVLILRPSTLTCPKLVCEAEIMEETDRVCRDYIVHKMTQRDLMSRKVTISASDWPMSSHVITACLTLEHLHPKTFSNVSRKLCMTMSSVKVVKMALNSVLEVIFEGNITWGKVVAMMSVSSLFAEECASQGHPDFVSDVVDTVMDVTSGKLLEWLVSQGGWASFPCGQKETRLHLNVARSLSLVTLALTVFLSSTWIFDHWSMPSSSS